MAGFFKRLFQLGSSEAHSIIDQLEDPVKMTEQGIRELKSDLEKAMQSFAEVKAASIRAQRDIEKNKTASLDWERKAMALLQQGQSGKLQKSEADRLATEALKRKEESGRQLVVAQGAYDTQIQNVNTLQKNIETLKSTIQQYENELITLKARAKTASATKKINKQLSNIDSSGTVALLERMKQKVEEEESLAHAYGDINQIPNSIDDEINQALLTDSGNTTEKTSEQNELEALKAKMGLS